jgi:peptidoglycan/LPS O-acetylase OafA/YrhL
MAAEPGKLVWNGDRRAIRGFDGLRACAVGLVILHHVWARAGNSATGPVAHALGAGWIGVDLFFSLSGFLITGILIRSRDGPAYFKNFYVRRALRIFPAYFAYLAAILVLRVAAGDAGPCMSPWVYAVFGSNYPQATCDVYEPMLGHLWSLAVEEQFYLVWPLAVALCSRRILWGLVIAILVASPLIRLSLFSLGGQVTYMWSICRMDALGWGALFALAWEERRTGWVWAARHAALPLVGLTAIAACLGWLDRREVVFATVGQSGVALAVGALVLALASGGLGRLTRILDLRPFVWVGRISFGVYLIQGFWIDLLHMMGLASGATLGADVERHVAFGLVAISLSLVSAGLSYRLFEEPILAFKDRWAPRDERGPAIGTGPTAGSVQAAVRT